MRRLGCQATWPATRRAGLLLVGVVPLLTLAACGDDSSQANPTTTVASTTVAPATTTIATTAPATSGPQATTTTPGGVSCPPVPAPDPATGVGLAGIMAFDTATGSLAWEQPAAGSVSIAGAGPVVVSADDTAVRAHDATTGSLRWCRPGGGLVVATTDTVVVAGASNVVGLDPATGAERWSNPAVAPGDGAPLTAMPDVLRAGAQNVYLDLSLSTPNGAVTALDAATGEQRWTWQPTSCPDTGLPATCVGGPWRPVEGALVYVSDINANRVVALDPATGAERWAVALRGQPMEVSTGDGVVAVGAMEFAQPNADGTIPAPRGQLRVLDAVTGGERWSAPFSGVSATAAGDLVVTITQLGLPTEPPVGTSPVITTRIDAFDAATGTLRWSQELRNETPLTVTQVSDLLILESAGMNGGPGFLALDPATGQERWRSDHPSPYTTPVFSSTSGYEPPEPVLDGGRFASVIRSSEPGD